MATIKGGSMISMRGWAGIKKINLIVIFFLKKIDQRIFPRSNRKKFSLKLKVSLIHNYIRIFNSNFNLKLEIRFQNTPKRN